MPELPEATTIARGLGAALAGARVREARLLRRDFLKTGRPGGLARLGGAWIDSVTRRGKWVVFRLDDGRRLVLQLGMAGRVFIQPAGEPLPPHTHLLLTLQDRRQVRCANARRIAAGVHLLAAGRSELLDRLGPDADGVSRREFLRRLAGRRTPVKAALMNQAVLAGVGNIYSDEALFRSGIRPARRVHRLSAARLHRLYRVLQDVLAEAIAAGGSTLAGANPYAGADGELGLFTQAHQVYGRYGQPCRRCGSIIRRATIGGRTSSFCPACQK